MLIKESMGIYAVAVWLLLPLAMPAFTCPVRVNQKMTHSQWIGWFTSGFE